MKFYLRQEAEDFIRRHSHVAPQEVKSVSNHFEGFANFTPRPKTAFADEFERLAASQGWEKGSGKYREDRVLAMSKELAHHYFPQPRIKQEPDSDYDSERSFATNEYGSESNASMDDDDPTAERLAGLTESQRLKGYQALCRQTGHAPGTTVEECISSLKGAPYVNIYDLIDVQRTGQPVRVFNSFDTFRMDTNRPGRRIDREFEKKDGFWRACCRTLSLGLGAMS